MPRTRVLKTYSPGSTSRLCILLKTSFLSTLALQVRAGWGSTNDDTTIFGNTIARDWLSDSTAINMNLEGCMWGVVNHNEEDADSGCMEDESEDGTTYWYQMANCRRAQVAFSMYATSSGSSASCSSSNFKESFVTINGVSDFISLIQNYDPYSPFGDENGDNNNGYDDGYYGNWDELPMCEEMDGYYVGIGCADDGSFSLLYFDDSYCLMPTGQTYDNLYTFNNLLSQYKSCANIYTSSSGDNSLAYYLVYYSDTCTSLDSNFCSDNGALSSKRAKSSGRISRNHGFGAGKSWLTKLKYVAGGLLLLASFVMFTGILFTNRRRRRALMQRKYRQSKGRDERSRKSKGTSRSKSKSRSRRSKSRQKERANSGGEGGGGKTDEGEGSGVLA